MNNSLWETTKDGLVREYAFSDFSTATRFVENIARLAQEHNHHPDIVWRYNKVVLTLFTHDAQAITKKDYDLAGAIDAL